MTSTPPPGDAPRPQQPGPYPAGPAPAWQQPPAGGHGQSAPPPAAGYGQGAPPLAMPPSGGGHGNRTLVVVLAIVAVLALLCCGGAVTAGVVVWRTFGRDAVAARSTTDHYLRDLRRGDTGAAYQRLCSQITQAVTPGDFDAIVREKGLPDSYSITGVSVHKDDGTRTARTTTRLTVAGTTRNQTFTLVREDGVWRICGDAY